MTTLHRTPRRGPTRSSAWISREVRGRRCQYAPLPSAAGRVRTRMETSVRIDQFSMYSRSSLTTSSKSTTSLRPLTCHRPVMPGQHVQPLEMMPLVLGKIAGEERSRADQAHFPAEARSTAGAARRAITGAGRGPIRVTRGSFRILNRRESPDSFSPASADFSASAPSRIVRNLSMRNGRPPTPARVWPNRIGPRESSLMASADQHEHRPHEGERRQRQHDVHRSLDGELREDPGARTEAAAASRPDSGAPRSAPPTVASTRWAESTPSRRSGNTGPPAFPSGRTAGSRR